MSTTVWWVADPGDPDDYEARYQEVSPKFVTRELAVAWKEREEQQEYEARLKHRTGIADAFERLLAVQTGSMMLLMELALAAPWGRSMPRPAVARKR